MQHNIAVQGSHADYTLTVEDIRVYALWLYRYRKLIKKVLYKVI